jgi:hypothetical protein
MGHWVIDWQDVKYSSDDFTLDELGRIEAETETPWSIANCLREIKVARAFLGVVFDRAGIDRSELPKLTLGQIKGVFAYEADPDDEPVTEDEEGDPDPLGGRSTSRRSSGGARAGSAGRRKKHAGSASVTST